MWAETARATVDAVRRQPELGVPDDVVDAFDRYVREWADIAARGDVFEWRGEIEPAFARRLASHWVMLVTIARERGAEATGIVPAPPDAQEFFDALALAFATASGADDEEAFVPVFEQARPAFDERSPEPPAATAPTRVLIVDDNEDIRLLFSAMLDFDPAFEVVGEAADGQRAVEIAAELHPDAILLDVSMPVMDGLTALPLLRAACPAATIVIVTARPDSSILTTARERGADDVVLKNVKIADLKRAIRP